MARSTNKAITIAISRSEPTTTNHFCSVLKRMLTPPALEQEPFASGSGRLPLTLLASAVSVVRCFCSESCGDSRLISKSCLSVRAMILLSSLERTGLRQ